MSDFRGKPSVGAGLSPYRFLANIGKRVLKRVLAPSIHQAPPPSSSELERGMGVQELALAEVSWQAGVVRRRESTPTSVSVTRI